jgi:hypothetical protein
MPYEVFKKTRTLLDTPTLFIAPGGRITTNAAATRILTERGIRSILLLWDAVGNKIALKAAPKGDQNSYTLSVMKESSGRIKAKSFLSYIGWSGIGREAVPVAWNEKGRMFEGTLSAENLGKRSKSKH